MKIAKSIVAILLLFIFFQSSANEGYEETIESSPGYFQVTQFWATREIAAEKCNEYASQRRSKEGHAGSCGPIGAYSATYDYIQGGWLRCFSGCTYKTSMPWVLIKMVYPNPQSNFSPPDATCDTCPCQDGTIVGQPIIPGTGEKFRLERDIVLNGPHPLTLDRVYRSGRVWGGTKQLGVTASRSHSGSNGSNGGGMYQGPAISPMGQGWTTNFIARLNLDSSKAHLSFGEGKYRSFSLIASTNLWAAIGHKDRLSATHPTGALSAGSIFTYQAFDSDKKMIFLVARKDNNSTGHSIYTGTLSQIVERNGWVTSVEIDINSSPDALRPSKVINNFGQQLRFGYTAAGYISTVTSFTAANEQVAQVQYSYDTQGRLNGSMPNCMELDAQHQCVVRPAKRGAACSKGLAGRCLSLDRRR